ncbi:alanyl-tRNA editing protein [Limibacillus halophilus]|uniref:Alanine--tRNA ligase n=1 Tax=Limibacillus halophilus TaxID=1579333 RepID=A0A839SUX1_9PROT|nr:alanyl-tRNA editing protein [Limibacillus halophilus]MBB3065514.1 misacylated tRNA(Ala) deacylase [Limibacillus halophilus]
MTALFREDSYLKECTATVIAAGPDGVSLDQTVFYPTGGGQPGDSGVLVLADGTQIRVVEARKGAGPDDVLHILEEGSLLPKPGDAIIARIDWDRRYRHMRMHSCLHVLCSLIDGDVTGGQVGDGKGRLDFNLAEAPDKEVLSEALNRVIAEDHMISPRWISDQELASSPDLVRTMSVAPPTGFGSVRLLEIEGVDLQACGGTHVARTAEIGKVVVRKIENKGKQNRRINLAFDEA